MEREYVNREESSYYEGHGYDVNMYGCGTIFRVYADSLGEGLELVGEYCKNMDYQGLYTTRPWQELLAECNGDEDILDENWTPINGGEFYLNIFCVSVNEFTEESPKSA